MHCGIASPHYKRHGTIKNVSTTYRAPSDSQSYARSPPGSRLPLILVKGAFKSLPQNVVPRSRTREMKTACNALNLHKRPQNKMRILVLQFSETLNIYEEISSNEIVADAEPVRKHWIENNKVQRILSLQKQH